MDEIQHILTDVAFIDRGRIVLRASMEEVETRYAELLVGAENLAAARALKPIHERQIFGRGLMIFDGIDRAKLAGLGEVRTPGLADLFVATMGGSAPREAAA